MQEFLLKKTNTTFSPKAIHLTLISSIILWTIVTDAWKYSLGLFSNLPSIAGTNGYWYMSRIIWVIPFLFLLIKKPSCVTVQFKQLFTNKIHWKSTIIIFISLVIYVFMGMLLEHRGFGMHQGIVVQLIPQFLIVGFVEEIVYRGWGMNALSSFMTMTKANIIASIYFGLLHAPAFFINWFLTGDFSAINMIKQVIFAFLMGIVFGYLFKKSKSILPSICFHFIYDFAIILFVFGAP